MILTLLLLHSPSLCMGWNRVSRSIGSPCSSTSLLYSFLITLTSSYCFLFLFSFYPLFYIFGLPFFSFINQFCHHLLRFASKADYTDCITLQTLLLIKIAEKVQNNLCTPFPYSIDPSSWKVLKRKSRDSSHNTFECSDSNLCNVEQYLYEGFWHVISPED